MTDYNITPLVRGLPATVPFVGPETQERERGRSFTARIGANENVFGPSPIVIEAISRAAAESWMYGDPEIHELRYAIAEHHEVEAENILIGEGIDGLLGYATRMFIEPGDKVVTSAGAYPTFNYHVVGLAAALSLCLTKMIMKTRKDCSNLRCRTTPSFFIWQTRIIRWELGGMPMLSNP